MPNYRKKNVRRATKRSKRQIKDIEMKKKRDGGEKASEDKGGKLRVVKGNKKKRQAITRAVFITAIIVAVILITANFLLPTGIGDFITGVKYSLSSGEYPISLVGGDSLLSQKQGSLIYTLTDTNLEVYSLGGKKALSSAHGFSTPVIKTSPTRAVVYEQGGKGLKLYGAEKLIFSKNYEDNIISAGLSRSGAYAVATTSKDFASKVTVYSKNSKMLFEWSSSVEIVSDVALSPTGNKLAVSVFSSQNGQYLSKVYIFGFDSATPLYTTEYKGSLIYSLSAQSNSGIFAVYNGGMDFISWGKFKESKFTTDYQVRMQRGTNSICALASSRSNDKKDTKITTFSSGGKQLFEINWKQSITDFAVMGDKILILSDTSVYLLDKNGNVLKKGDAGFGGVSVQAVSTEKAVVVTDNSLISVALTATK
ncbi:MAG: hypothetical protein IJX79_04565 [Clostridia bacterium]|nr:hypothetical protein [Clostridia bacterium]